MVERIQRYESKLDLCGIRRLAYEFKVAPL